MPPLLKEMCLLHVVKPIQFKMPELEKRIYSQIQHLHASFGRRAFGEKPLERRKHRIYPRSYTNTRMKLGRCKSSRSCTYTFDVSQGLTFNSNICPTIQYVRDADFDLSRSLSNVLVHGFLLLFNANVWPNSIGSFTRYKTSKPE